MAHRARQTRRRRGTDKPRAAGSVLEPAAAPRAGATWEDAALFTAIVLFAFALRVIYVLQLRSSPLFADPQMDELYHDQWAQAIAAGTTFIEGPYFRAPLYPAFLAGVYRVFGHGYLAPRVIQGVLGALSCGLLFLVGRIAFGRVVGAVAGFAAASYWMLIYFDGELLIPSLIAFLNLLLVWLLLRAARAPGKVAYGLAGLVLGLSAIARPNILLFGPAIVIWLGITHRRELRRALAYIVCVTAGCLLVVLPITVRNYVVGHDLVLIASQGGVNFYIGNNPRANGWTAIVPGTPGGWWAGYYAAIERAEQARGRKLKPSEVSQYYYEQAWDFIGQQPGRFLALLGSKLNLFWSKWEITNNKGIYFWSGHFTPVLKLLPLRFAVLGPLGILGLVLCWRRRAELFPVWGYILVYMASVVLFFCNARYRVPILPPLILLATCAVFQGVSAIGQRRWGPVTGGLAVLALAGVFVHVSPAAAGFRNDAQDYVRLGEAYDRQDRPELAAESYRQALELSPDYLSARYKLGKVLAKMRRLPEAITELRRAVATRPRLENNETSATVALVHNDLGAALVNNGEYAEAIEHYQAAIALDPQGTQGDAQFNLGEVLRAEGRIEEALDAFKQALAVNPNHHRTHRRLAHLLLRMGRIEQAIEHFRQVLRDQPDNAEVLVGLGEALCRQGRYGEALTPLRRSLRVAPGNVGALESLSLALLEVGHYQEAGEVLRRALPLRKPQLVSRLAFLMATCPVDALRDGAQALEYARQACPDAHSCTPAQLDALAAALAETGRFAEAADLARRALERAHRSSRASDRALIRPLGQRLRLYEAGQPYRLPRR